ncbi:MAG: ATP-binding protein [Actinomycetes bacterium]
MAHPQTPGGAAGPDRPAASPARLPVFQHTVTDDRHALRELRRDLHSWLLDKGANGRTADAVVLACSEAVANGLEHGLQGTPDASVTVRGVLDAGTLTLRVENPGGWDRTPSQSYRGHGLLLMERLMDAVEVSTGAGTVVTMQRRLSPDGTAGPRA